jgi:S1-C subfamily serine protease
VRRPWFGAQLQAVTREIAESLGLSRPVGALIANITDGSPAARAGLRPGDVIVAIDNLSVDDPNAFDYRFATKPLGGKAIVTVDRRGRAMNLAVALETAPEAPREEILIRGRSPFAGARVANLSPALAEELRVEEASSGVVILDISGGSSASMLGFRRGDVVLEVNGTRISRTRDLDAVTSKSSRVWEITILRGGQQLSVALRG